MKKTRKVRFVCPKCGGKSRLLEVTKGIIYYDVDSLRKIDEDNIMIEYSLVEEPGTDPQECLGFECSWCGYVLNGSPSDFVVNSAEELYEWLEEHDMLEEYHP